MNIITNNILKSEVALNELKQVMDPEIELNIVDLGLIYQIDFDEEQNEIYCAYTLTTQFCPMGESIQNNIMQVLMNTFSSYKINLELVFSPTWNQEMISEEGRKYLNN